MKKIVSLTTSCVCLFLAVACSSKFVEKQPGQVDGTDGELEFRLSQKGKMDERLDKVEQLADKVKRLLQAFKKVRAPNSRQDTYTPIDFLFDVNQELRGKLPTRANGEYVRKGSFKIRSSSVPEACRRVETELREREIDDGRQMVYAVKTCGTGEEFAEIFSVGLNDSSLSLKIHGARLRTLFVNTAVNAFEEPGQCNLNLDDRGVLESLDCHNLSLTLSDSETAEIADLVFSTHGEDRLRIAASILENGQAKQRVEITVKQNRRTKIENTPIAPPNATGAPAPATEAQETDDSALAGAI